MLIEQFHAILDLTASLHAPDNFKGVMSQMCVVDQASLQAGSELFLSTSVPHVHC